MLRPMLLAATLLTPALLFAAEPASHPRYGGWGVDTADMDQHAKPGDGFYGYVEGTWLRDHQIPADKVGAGYNYDLPDEIELQVRQMVEGVATNPTTPIARKIGDAYAAWMDEKGIEARGLAPLKPYLARIDAVKTRSQLVALMMAPGYASPVNIGISTDQDDPTRYAAAAGQARLGLPTRDYYLLAGEKYDAIRKAYRAYVVHIQQLAGLPDVEARADRIIALETSLARDQWTPERRRDPVATHNPMTRAQLMKLAPEFNWAPTLAGMGLASAQK
ncbi:MAG TPA: M13 family metallopeptidase N-terminal domain-containing protein, partial [Sphingomonas sp.]|nr:M13 family metallopeptidase N-terminal domain-containing protein [Sphingomonas sp.]